MLTWCRWLVVLGSVGCLAACSGQTREVGTPDAATTGAGVASTKVSAPMGPNGGTLRLTTGPARGATITIPAGALAKPVTITMQAAEVPLRSRQGIRFVGPIVDFGPSGTTFAKPVTLTLPSTEEGNAVYTQPHAGPWINVPGARYDRAKHAMIATTAHFSPFGPTHTDTATVDNFDIDFDDRFDPKNADTSNAFYTPDAKKDLIYAGQQWSPYIQGGFAPVPANKSFYIQDPTMPTTPFSLPYTIDDLLILVGTGPKMPGTNGGTNLVAVSGSDVLNNRLKQVPYQPWAAVVLLAKTPATMDLPTATWWIDSSPETSDDVPPTSQGVVDLVAVATHEIGHALAFIGADDGTTPFGSLISNGNFTGATAVCVYGGPVPMDPTGRRHFAPDVTFGGWTPVMHPYAQVRRISQLDLAVLQDVGYTINWTKFCGAAADNCPKGPPNCP